MHYRKFLRRIKPFCLNTYVIFTSIYIIWMLFFDDQNIFSQYRLYKTIRNLEKDLRYYDCKIKEVEQEKQALLNNSDLLEKYAREKYYMKRQTEDLYIIVEE